MNLFGVPISFTNGIGFYSLIAFLLLLLLYLMQPKPIKKTIPSLIFLEWNSNKKQLTAFFQKFLRDWLFLLQFLAILMLCLASMGMAAQLHLSSLSENVAIVIDASASANVDFNGKPVFEEYKEIAKNSLGLKSTIIAIKNNPEVLAKETNLLNANRVIASIRPSSSLSNIWDSMMMASQYSDNIIVISDFVDTNSRDLSVAKQLIEAKGAKVILINPRSQKARNLGLVNFEVKGKKAEIVAKNFDDQNAQTKVSSTQEVLDFLPNEQRTFHVDLAEGINTIKIEDDDFLSDNTLNIILPQEQTTEVLLISSKKNNLYHALSSIRDIDISVAQPPIVPISDERLIVLSDLDYGSLLPGTLDEIRQKVNAGASLIIAGQKGLDASKLGDLLPVIVQEKQEEISVINNGIEKFKNYDFGLSSRYLKADLIDNRSIVISSYYDRSPAVVFSRYGQGNILYYGIIDDQNSFKLSTQYPLFWISALEMMLGKTTLKDINLKIGDMLYGETIITPGGEKIRKFVQTKEVGIYDVAGKKVSVNLMSEAESNINLPTKFETQSSFEKKKAKQTVSLIPYLIAIAILAMIIELVAIKRRGDV